MNTEIMPGDSVIVYDPWAFGSIGYWRGEGAFREAVVVRRYGYISEYMEREYGRDAAKYPDCIDVIFLHSSKLSKGHFTEGVKKVRPEGSPGSSASFVILDEE